MRSADASDNPYGSDLTYHAVTGDDEDGNDFDELNEEFQRSGDDEGEHGDSKFHDRRCLPG